MTTNPPDQVAKSRLAVAAAGWAMDLLMVAGVWLGAARLASWHWPLTAGQMAYGMGLGAVVLAGWRGWRRHSAAALAEPVAEPLRVLLVTVAAVGVMSPMFTDRFLGGTDARWYAYMLHDFIEQWRSNGPPVFLGLGEHVWNGAVHPFRSAPVYMHVAGLWDWLSLQSLSVMALQHLTAITAALTGAWGMYVTGVALAPSRRWEVAAVAVLYVLSPASLMTLYIADAYMTYLASAAYVWVFSSNVRLLTGGGGWLHLAAALSLTWMTHPPTAMLVTLISALLQAGGLALGPAKWADWRRAAGAAALFVLLSLYYFAGMSELPAAPGGALGKDLLQVVGLGLSWFVCARMLVARREWWWLLLLVPSGGMLWLTCKVWLGWLALTAGLLGVGGLLVRRRGGWDATGYAPLMLLAGILAGAVMMDCLLRAGWAAGTAYPTVGQQLWSATWACNYFQPLSPFLLTEGDYQPGWGLWLAGLAAGLAAGRRGATATQLVFGALVLLAPLLLHWPRAGDFMLEYLPRNLTNMTGITMKLRVMPVFSALLAMGGVMALRESRSITGRARWLLDLVLLLAVGWAAWQARLFVIRGHQITAPLSLSAKDWRPENAPMDRFVYDLLPIPSYFSHGKMDPRLEVRLLDDRGNLIYGPPQIVEAMEAAGSQTIRLDTHPIPGHAGWLQLEPRLVLQPGEHRLLRFQFDPAHDYAGYLLLLSEHGYREYLLPESGMRRSFGTGPEHSRVISLWNSGKEPEHYQMQFKLGPGGKLGPGMQFATLTVSAFQPERALMQVESLNPWRVRTRMPWSGQLETPRIFLPGYEVKVDGRRIGPSRISASPDRLLQIAMPPGEHVVEVDYAGTWQLRLAGAISLAAWVAVLIWLFQSRLKRTGSTAF
ncbi:MAG: hypothetical protein ACOZE5_03765 [Verrucomicrobiota bacterium]